MTDEYDHGAIYSAEVEASIKRQLNAAEREIVTLTANFVSRDMY